MSVLSLLGCKVGSIFRHADFFFLNMQIFKHLRKILSKYNWFTVLYYFLLSSKVNQLYMHMKVKVAQSCPTLCDPIDCSPSGFFVLGILQARTLEWVAVPFSRDLPNPGIELRSPALQADSLLFELLGNPNTCICYVLICFSGVRLFAAPWTIVHKAPLSMGLHRQEYWSGLTCPPSGNLSDPGGRTHVSYISCIGGGFFTAEPPGKPICLYIHTLFLYSLLL